MLHVCFLFHCITLVATAMQRSGTDHQSGPATGCSAFLFDLYVDIAVSRFLRAGFAGTGLGSAGFRDGMEVENNSSANLWPFILHSAASIH
jgi:hypothetical protein